MKTVLLSLAVVIACIATAHSASPLDTWKDELKELNRDYSLEHQEQVPVPLNCFTCTQDCANTEVLGACPPSPPNFVCSTYAMVLILLIVVNSHPVVWHVAVPMDAMLNRRLLHQQLQQRYRQQLQQPYPPTSNNYTCSPSYCIDGH
ncbi:hypothetical protein ACROYT_G017156 [Oculina patagonica]